MRHARIALDRAFRLRSTRSVATAIARVARTQALRSAHPARRHEALSLFERVG